MSGAPTRLVRRVVTLAPGDVMAYDEAAWLDAIVFLDSGDIVLECVRGQTRRFVAGHILFLAGLPLRWIRNPGEVEARLVAVARLRGQERSQVT